ncbi:MAG: peptidoglycan-binding domain-containing protein [Pseudomonadota bacterium]
MKARKITSLAAMVSVALLAGCASDSATTTATSTANAQTEALISSQKSTISDLERQLKSREQELAAARRASDQAPMPAPVSSELFPPNAEPGHCYARILTPATYKTTTETVLAKEASERVEIIPAQYETVKERVLVKEASSRLEIVPAVYETVSERVLIKPATTRIEQIPATYRTESERVLVTPARTEWKRGPATTLSRTGEVLDSRTTDTGEIMCLVEVPAVYKTVSRQVVDRAASTREITIPAEYKMVEKRVLKTPATTREVVIPAEYGSVDTVRVVSDAKERRIAIPAEYTTVTKREKVSEDVLDWREVVCDVNLNRANVSELQTALKKAGYYKGPLDGIIGPMTLSAANSYARAKQLPVGTNYIAIDTIEKLGLKF